MAEFSFLKKKKKTPFLEHLLCPPVIISLSNPSEPRVLHLSFLLCVFVSGLLSSLRSLCSEF